MTDYMITLNKSDDHCFKSGPGSHKRIDIYGNCLFVGLDDTFSEEECRELTEFLQSALENGILRAEKCELCNNDCLDLFMFEHVFHYDIITFMLMPLTRNHLLTKSGFSRR